jgi:HPt (histidine-containing phosphotransfer) domain-containing protein
MKAAPMTAVLDRDHLARYTAGDAALEAELFSLLEGQIDACAAVLEQTGDEGEWRAAAHTLKGAARGVGAMALGEACAAAEDQPLNPAAALAVRDEAEKARTAMAAAKAA